MVPQRVALVTGSTAGIGLAVARAFAGEGLGVVIHGRDLERGEQVADEIRKQGGRASFARADLRESAECARLVTAAVDTFGRIDILVNNVAVVFQGPTGETPEATLEELLAVNVRAPYLLVQAALPQLRKASGAIINITGSPAYRGAPASSAFAASKAALHSLTRSWAAEFGPLGIRVNEISPGLTDTRLSRPILDDPERLAAIVQRMPARRVGTPESIARAALFLASDQADYVYGATLAVDGGLLA